MFVAAKPRISPRLSPGVSGDELRTHLSAWTEVRSAVLTEFSSGKTIGEGKLDATYAEGLGLCPASDLAVVGQAHAWRKLFHIYGMVAKWLL